MNLVMPSSIEQLAPTPWELPRQARDGVRARSKALLGNRDRMEVAVAIAISSDGIVNAADLSERLGMANNRVRTNLLALAESGMLDALPQPDSNGRRWFRRTASPFWAMSTVLYNDWIKDVRLVQDLSLR